MVYLLRIVFFDSRLTYLLTYLLAREAEQAFEGSSKLVVEDGIDNWVQETVDVTEPHEEREEDRVETTDAGQLEKVVANTRGVDDVEGEERNPAEQKHTCHSTAHNGARMLT